jgi:hypothetical protein
MDFHSTARALPCASRVFRVTSLTVFLLMSNLRLGSSRRHCLESPYFVTWICRKCQPKNRAWFLLRIMRGETGVKFSPCVCACAPALGVYQIPAWHQRCHLGPTLDLARLTPKVSKQNEYGLCNFVAIWWNTTSSPLVKVATDTITVVYNCRWSLKTQHLDVVTGFETIFRFTAWLLTHYAPAQARWTRHRAGASRGYRRYIYTETHRLGKFSVNHSSNWQCIYAQALCNCLFIVHVLQICNNKWA